MKEEQSEHRDRDDSDDQGYDGLQFEVEGCCQAHINDLPAPDSSERQRRLARGCGIHPDQFRLDPEQYI